MTSGTRDSSPNAGAWRALLSATRRAERRSLAIQTAEAEQQHADPALGAARSSLLTFVERMYPGYQVAPHHRLLAEHLEAVERGDIRRLIVELPPRHGKSLLTSVHFPAWYLGRQPRRQVIAASYAAELAYTFSRQARNLFTAPGWPFPAATLADDARGVEHWSLSAGGSYVAAGVGGSITGHGADLLLLDDPIRNREDADSDTVRESQWEWYTSTARTRLQPGGAIVLCLCMTGDTPVLMADGSELPLREIKVGDTVATYDNGKLGTSTVRNHKSNGPDFCLRIKTISGKTVHANERHPFLVEEHGQLKWTRVRDLSTAHRIVIVKGNGVSGKVRLAALSVATSLLARGVIAVRTTAKRCGPMGIAPQRSLPTTAETHVSSSGTELPQRNTMHCSQRKTVSALSANSPRGTMCTPIGAGSCVSTTATKPIPSECFCVTTATSPWGMSSQKQSHWPLPDTSDFTTERIASIEPAGVEEVFDLQVERTENFIANGLVSHNTRWHEEDLAGRLLRVGTGAGAGTAARAGPSGEGTAVGESWTVLRLPARAEPDDPLGRPEGAPLWPEWFGDNALTEIERAIGSRNWMALYQQRPSAQTGNLLQRDWWQTYTTLPKAFSQLVQSWDMAFKDTTASDYVVGQVWGRLGADYYLLDQVRGRLDFPATLAALRALSARWPLAVTKLVEDAANGPAVIATLRHQVPGLVAVPAAGGKLSRVNAIAPLVEAGNVYLPAVAAWRDAFTDECAAFPRGSHDDQVDAMSQALIRLSAGQLATVGTANATIGGGYDSPRMSGGPGLLGEHKRRWRQLDVTRRG